MAKKAVLGKGLSALLPGTENLESGEPAEDLQTPRSRLYHFEERVRLLGRVAEIEVDKIRPNPYQPRKDFDEEALNELAHSIKQLGIIQPITVRALGNHEFEVISGERRLRAARRAGLKKIPAYIRDADTEAMLEMALVENIQRADLNPIEIALSYQRLLEECGLTQEEVAAKVGKKRSTITNYLRLLRLPPQIQAGLKNGTLTQGHARMLVNIEDPELQMQLYEEIVQKQLSVREVERRVREIHQPARTSPKSSPSPTPDPHIQDVTNRLRTRFSTQVAIRHRSDGSGKIELTYYSLDDLERLLELLLAEDS